MSWSSRTAWGAPYLCWTIACIFNDSPCLVLFELKDEIAWFIESSFDQAAADPQPITNSVSYMKGGSAAKGSEDRYYCGCSWRCHRSFFNPPGLQNPTNRLT